jgi:hypothetical protein
VENVTYSIVPTKNSTIPGSKHSVYELVHPVFRLNEQGIPIELIGSCAQIARMGIYLTAAHLFPIFESLNGERRKPEILQRRILLREEDNRIGIFKRNNLESFSFHKAHSVNVFFHHDIAIIHVIHDSPDPLPPGPRLPIKEDVAKGAGITVLGYPASSNQFKVECDENNKIKVVHFTPSMVKSEGKVVDLHPNGESNSICFFPTIESDAKTEPGHSGGPVMTNDFGLIGICSSSFDDGNSQFAWISKVLDEEFSSPGLSITAEDGTQTNCTKITLRKLMEKDILGTI